MHDIPEQVEEGMEMISVFYLAIIVAGLVKKCSDSQLSSAKIRYAQYTKLIFCTICETGDYYMAQVTGNLPLASRSQDYFFHASYELTLSVITIVQFSS